MREVEAQALRPHVRARLVHMLAEHSAQRGMQDMGAVLQLRHDLPPQKAVRVGDHRHPDRLPQVPSAVFHILRRAPFS